MVNTLVPHTVDREFSVMVCYSCHSPTLWYKDRLVYPDASPVALPNPDLPDEIKADYDEAREILNRSPRGAAALLRLAIQKICKHLGQPGKRIDDDIAALVAAGLPQRVQQSLDTVRVIGNEAVHPGAIDLRDDRETAGKLFKLVNFIADKMITEPREIDEIYATLPPSKIEGIDKRDGRV